MNRKEEVLAELVCRMYDELKSGNAVSRKLDISSKTVYRLLHQAGIDIPDSHSAIVQERKKKLHGEKANNVVQDYANGMKLSDMREKYGVSAWAIKTAVRDAGGASRPHGAQSRLIKDEEALEMVSLYKNERLSQVQIAMKMRCSQPVVSRVLREYGIETFRMLGKNHGSWKGGRMLVSGGYIEVYMDADDPLSVMQNRMGYVKEHRLVLARSLGRPLTDKETVHHINGNRTDNRLENLQLRIGKHGTGVVYQCADCGSFHVLPVKISESSKD